MDPKPLGRSLAESIRSDSNLDLLATVSDAVLSAGGLESIPIIGSLTGLYKAQRDVREQLFVRKIARFLSELAKTSDKDRDAFTDRLAEKGKLDEFGETIILILERLDEVQKPKIVGRIMAAHVKGEIDYETAMRLISIVARAYVNDLEWLRNFAPGTQGAATPIAETLFACGLLSNAGIDGGTDDDPNSGGVLYELNHFGHLFLKFGFD